MNWYKHSHFISNDPYIDYSNADLLKCILCNMTLGYGDKKRHLIGKNHRRMLRYKAAKTEGVIHNDPYILCDNSNGGHLEGRMHQESLHLHTMNKERLKRYNQILNSDDSGNRQRENLSRVQDANEANNYMSSLPYKQYLDAKTTLEATTVLIKDVPDFVTRLEILQCFEKFGRLANQYYFNKINHYYALIQFCDPVSLIELHNDGIRINGIKLDIKSFGQIALQNNLDFLKINQTLKEAPYFQAQLNILLKYLQPQQLTSQYELICSDLQVQLKYRFPRCVVFPFGAASTGLGFTTSLVHLHVEYNQQVGSSKHLHRKQDRDYIREIKKIMEKYNLVFLHTPPTVQYPRRKDNLDVKCVHNATQLKCNIYFTQSESVRSSSLIRYYLLVTDKLKPLIIIIKYWGKMHKLIEPSFSSFALTLLLILYLQQTPCYLPPVEYLQQSNKNSLSADFVLNQKFVFEPLNQSIPEILEGFFNYYANFDYSLYIISPYLGKLVLKTDFFVNENMNKADFLPKIFLQHPLDHSYNVTRMVPDLLLHRFVEVCRVSAVISKNLLQDQLGLYKLFTYYKSCIPENYYSSATRCWFKISINNQFEFISSEIQKNNILDPEKKYIQTKMIWYNLVKKFLISIFSDLMKFDINNSSQVKSQRLNEQFDVHDTHTIDSVTLHCSRSGIYDIKDTEKKTVVLNDIGLADQYQLLRLICEKSLILSTCTLTLNMQTKFNPTQVDIFLTLINQEEGYFYGFGKLFARYFPNWFEKYMTELDAQSLKYKRMNTNEQLHVDDSDDSSEIKFVPNENDHFKCTQVETVQETECQSAIQIIDDPDNIQNILTGVFQVKSEPTEANIENDNQFTPGFVKVLVNETGRLLELQDFQVEQIEARRIKNSDITFDKPEFIKVLYNDFEQQSCDKDALHIKLEPET